MNEKMMRMYQAANLLKGIDGGSALAKLLGETPQTIKNWETRGPSKSGLIKAQTQIGCFVSWLETGEGQMASAELDFISKPQKTVPLISWAGAKNWEQTIDELIPTEAAQILVTCPVSSHTYALLVSDDANEPKFPIGSWIVVEPDETPINQKWCVVDEGGEEATLKQLVINGNTKYLRNDNPRFPIKEMGVDHHFCGTVKQLIMSI